MKYFIGIFLTLVLVGGGCERDAMRKQKKFCEDMGLGYKYVAKQQNPFIGEQIVCVNN